MILFQVYLEGIAAFPFEGDSPRAVDSHGPAFRLALESMKNEAGYIQLRQSHSFIQNIEAADDPLPLILADSTAVPCLEDFLESLVSP